MKRLTTILVALAVVLIAAVLLLPTEARAATVASGTCGTNLTWTLDDAGTLTISGSGDMYDYAHRTAPWSSHVYSITALVIEDGVTGIGDYAFSELNNITSVVIPEGITRIGKSAFDCCTGLVSITLPDSLVTIGESAFYACSGLTGICIPDMVTQINNSAFYYCTGLTSLRFPGSIATIGEYAFLGCSKLSDLVFCGTAEDWLALSVSAGNTPLTNAVRQYHAWNGNTCAYCGESKPAPSFTAGVINPKSVTLSLDDLIFLNIYSEYTGGTLSQAYIETHGGLIYWNAANFPADGVVSIDDANAIVVPGLAYNTGNSRYLGTTEDIALKNLGDDLKICSYVELPDGTIMYSRVITYSGKRYAMSRINAVDSLTNPTAKDLAEQEVCISMLNAVYEAQKFFTHNLDAPANAELSAARQVVNYSADMITPAIAIDRDLERDKTVFSSRGASLALEVKIEMTFTFTIPAQYMSTAKDTGMLYWSREDYATATVLDASSATYTGELEATATADKYSAIYPRAFATKEYEDTVYACAYLIDADSNCHYSGIIAYNVEAYAKSKINGNSAEADLCKALVVYGEAAKAYFAL